MIELKNYLYRICKLTYWHCAIDEHQGVEFAGRRDAYVKFVVKGVREGYRKDLIMWSSKGIREFGWRGKNVQIISFLAMLVIFVCVIGCTGAEPTGYCLYKDEMILMSAGLMLALMGMKVVTRNKFKRKLDKKIQQLERQEKQE